jgi:hypothetical protein
MFKKQSGCYFTLKVQRVLGTSLPMTTLVKNPRQNQKTRGWY